jgi:HEPN domain-containing protein
MTPDRLRLEETRAWLDRAQRDLRAARLLIAGDANAEALFHCQQAVEKALKAFLTYHQKPFRKTHDLGDLSTHCLAIDDLLESAVGEAEGLTPYAWHFRESRTNPKHWNSAQGLRKAEAAVQEIERRLAL